MHKQVAVGLIPALLVAVGFAAVPAAQARGHFAPAFHARGAVGGHFGHFAARSPQFGHAAVRAPRFRQFTARPPQLAHRGQFAPSRPRFEARAIGPQRFAPGRFRSPGSAAPRFAPGVHMRGHFLSRPAPPVARFAPGVRHFRNDDHRFPRFRGDDDRLPAWHRRFWGGGYWGGQFWPRVYYGVSFNWFLPVLPSDCPVYWYDDMSYYYCDDVYYVWNPEYSGYVVTDPPPVGDVGSDGTAAAAGDTPSYPTPSYADSASAEVYAYPERGQSEQQQQQDRRECAQWAASQTSSLATVTVADYRRAMISCFEARGYSAR